MGMSDQTYTGQCLGLYEMVLGLGGARAMQTPIFPTTVMVSATTAGFPPELKNILASFCPLDSLAVLALANREFQAHAETFLYASVVVSMPDNEAGPLPTLVANPGKASLVKFLSFETSRRRRSVETSAMDMLLRSAPAMKNLKDMRILLRKDLQETAFVKGLEDVLCAHHFQLEQLYTTDGLDFVRLLGSQKDLRVLGMYSAVSGYPGPMSLLSSHINRSICVLGLGWLTYLPLYDSVALFPDLLDADRAQTFDIDLRRSFAKDTMRSKKVGFDHVTELIVYLREVPPVGTFNVFMKTISRMFGRLLEISFGFGSCEGLMEDGRMEPVAWGRLEEVRMWCWDPKDETGLRQRNMPMAVSKHVFAAYVRKWHRECSELRILQICNGWQASRDDASDWALHCD